MSGTPTNSQIIANLELQIEDLTQQVKFAEKVKKLIESPLFKEVIIDGFSTKEASRYVAESVDPSLGKDQQADALALAQAPGHLKRWIMVKLQLAETAAATIESHRVDIEEYQAMEAGEQ